MPSLLDDSEPSGETALAGPEQESQQAPPDSLEVDDCDDNMSLIAARQASGRPPCRQVPSECLFRPAGLRPPNQPRPPPSPTVR